MLNELSNKAYVHPYWWITKEREIKTTSVLWIVSKAPWKSIIALSNPPKYVKGKTKQMVQILLISKQSKYFQNQKSINYLNINIFNQQLFEETDSQYFPTNLNCIKMFQYVLFTTKNCRPGKQRGLHLASATIGHW